MKHVIFDNVNFIINKNHKDDLNANLYVLEKTDEIEEIKKIEIQDNEEKETKIEKNVLSLDEFDVPPIVGIIDLDVRNKKKEKEKIIKKSVDLHNNPLYPEIQSAILDKFCGFGVDKCIHFNNCELLKNILNNVEDNLLNEGIIIATQIRFCPYKITKSGV